MWWWGRQPGRVIAGRPPSGGVNPRPFSKLRLPVLDEADDMHCDWGFVEDRRTNPFEYPRVQAGALFSVHHALRPSADHQEVSGRDAFEGRHGENPHPNAENITLATSMCLVGARWTLTRVSRFFLGGGLDAAD